MDPIVNVWIPSSKPTLKKSARKQTAIVVYKAEKLDNDEDYIFMRQLHNT